MNILGISCYYHDSAAALIVDGELKFAAQEERFTRKKHDASFPKNAIDFCLKSANLDKKDIHYVAFYDKPFLKFERILETYLSYAPKGIRSALKALPIWIKEKIWISDLIQKEFSEHTQILFPEHHLSHAASAFFPSPFDSSAILTLDGVGEWATTTLGIGTKNSIELIKEINFPHSLGLLYSAFTYFLGFKVNSGEYKVMGLAPYGKPKYTDLIFQQIIDVKDDGSFKMNMKYFNYAAGLTMTNSKFSKLFNRLPRKSESKLTQDDMDIAASVQAVTEEIVLRLARHAREITQSKNLCLAGGVALNCVANGKILKEKIFDKIWIQPAAGDAGGAVGSAFSVWYQYLENNRLVDGNTDAMKGSYLGPKFDSSEIGEFLTQSDAHAQYFETKSTLWDFVSDKMTQDKVVGWFNGRMEFGPRALGARSILGDPCSESMQKNLNVKIKFRESFRPFAPSILEEHVSEYFEMESDSPYMLLVAPVAERLRHPMKDDAVGLDKLYHKRSDLQAITHVDYSARVQTVSKATNPDYYGLISAFYEKTGCPVLINTSFNVRGEPIVCTPEEAYTCFMRTNMDVLVLENYVLLKEDQPEWKEQGDWREEYELD